MCAVFRPSGAGFNTNANPGLRPGLRSCGRSAAPGREAVYRKDSCPPQSVDKRCRRSHGRVERLAMDGPLVSRYLTLAQWPGRSLAANLAGRVK